MSVEVIRAADAEARRAIYRLRYRIYVEELQWTPPEVDHERRELHDPLDECSALYLLLTKGTPAGTLRITNLSRIQRLEVLRESYALGPALGHFDPREIILSGRFMLHPRMRHGSAILSLIRRGYEDARRDGARLNFADCSPHLLPLYEHLGYRRYTDPFNDPHFGYKLPILMVMGDLACFAASHSPLVRVAREFPDDPEARAWFRSGIGVAAHPTSASLMPEGMFLDLLAERVGQDPVHHLSLLKGLSHDEAQRFLSQATVIHARPGDRIIRQGEHDDTLYAMLDGIADVLLREAPDQPINLISTGDTFGEIGLIGGVPRTADVVARSECEVLVLSAGFFQRFLNSDPAISAKVTLNLAHSMAVRLAFATPGQIHVQRGDAEPSAGPR
jgi:CRP-like cAMP-binding protein/predicted GNAT family N-acyltransferase